MTSQQVLRLFHDERKGPPLIWNGAGTSPVLVCIPAKVMRDVVQHAMRGLTDQFPGGEQPDKAREVLGIFLGSSVSLAGRRLVIVQKMLPIEVRESNQPDFCEYRAEDKARVDHAIERAGLAAYKEVGWFHTHPEHPIFLSPPDQSLMRSHFSQADHFALVVKPKEGLGGIFVWDGDKVDGSEEDLAARGGSFSLQAYYTHQDWQKLIRMGAVSPDASFAPASAPEFTVAPSYQFDPAMEQAYANESTYIPRGASVVASPPKAQSPDQGMSRLMWLLIIVLGMGCLALGWRLWKQSKKPSPAASSRTAPTPPTIAARQAVRMEVANEPRTPPAYGVHQPLERIVPARRYARSARSWCLQVELSFQQEPTLQVIDELRGQVADLLRRQLPDYSVPPICRIRREQAARFIRCLVPSRKKVRWAKTSFRRALDAQQSLRGYVLSAERCRRCPCR